MPRRKYWATENGHGNLSLSPVASPACAEFASSDAVSQRRQHALTPHRGFHPCPVSAMGLCALCSLLRHYRRLAFALPFWVSHASAFRPSALLYFQRFARLYFAVCAAAVSGRKRRAWRRWPPSAAQTARAVFPHAAFTKIRLLAVAALPRLDLCPKPKVAERRSPPKSS